MTCRTSRTTSPWCAACRHDTMVTCTIVRNEATLINVKQDFAQSAKSRRDFGPFRTQHPLEPVVLLVHLLIIFAAVLRNGILGFRSVIS